MNRYSAMKVIARNMQRKNELAVEDETAEAEITPVKRRKHGPSVWHLDGICAALDVWRPFRQSATRAIRSRDSGLPPDAEHDGAICFQHVGQLKINKKKREREREREREKERKRERELSLIHLSEPTRPW